MPSDLCPQYLRFPACPAALATTYVSADFVFVKIQRSERRHSARGGALVEPSRLRAPCSRWRPPSSTDAPPFPGLLLPREGTPPSEDPGRRHQIRRPERCKWTSVNLAAKDRQAAGTVTRSWRLPCACPAPTSQTAPSCLAAAPGRCDGVRGHRVGAVQPPRPRDRRDGHGQNRHVPGPRRGLLGRRACRSLPPTSRTTSPGSQPRLTAGRGLIERAEAIGLAAHGDGRPQRRGFVDVAATRHALYLHLL
jgi:hypothetical protein